MVGFVQADGALVVEVLRGLWLLAAELQLKIMNSGSFLTARIYGNRHSMAEQ
jgi:hypothetical protein